ncbi:predicted membrane protein [Microbacterium testaceum StLB037]|uniref:Predicted membrane protein n=1 Tax=Microbacterium testaceum (strain StLB037) TaxID=979556 RepID=E8N8E1_MICTS|nr:hypothetical protein [Microbacterium testaceum]BAJ74386.1 predicted membrane protein [Microbacterium testaceum StLB037]
MSVHTAPGTSTLHWWAVAAVAVALIAPVPEGWIFGFQLATLAFAIVALCLVRGRAARSIAAAAVIVIGTVVCVQIIADITTLLYEQSFTEDAVIIG